MPKSPPIRIKVLLNHFYDDHRQKAIVTIDKSWTIVKNLQSHIQSMFQIKKLYLSTVDGFWFPSNECISVISDSDIVVAHPKQKAMKSKEAADLNDSNHFEANFQKNLFVTNVNSFTPKTRRDEPMSTTSPISVSANDSIMDQDRKKKRKRVRKRKLKKNGIEDEIEQQTSELPNKQSKWINDLEKFDVPEKLKLKKKGGKLKEIVPQPIKPKTHIWFSDDGKRHEGNKNEKDDNCLKSEEDNEPFILPAQARIVEATYTETEINLNTEDRQISANENISTISITPKQTTEMDNKTIKEAAGKENISVSDNTTENGTEKEETAMEKMRKNIDTLAFPTLINKPNLNDVIAFKTLKLTETYEPTMSEYIIGMVQKIDDDVITLFIMAGANQLKDPDGKFQLSNETSTEVDNNVTEVEFRQNELLEAKICQI